MLVHQCCPFIRRQVTEKNVGMRCAPLRTRGSKVRYQAAEPLTFGGEISLISNNKYFCGRSIAAHWSGKYFSFNQRAENPADEHSGRVDLADGHFHRGRAMRERLRGIHLAPKRLGVRP